jgi:hypothetical protein
MWQLYVWGREGRKEGGREGREGGKGGREGEAVKKF